MSEKKLITIEGKEKLLYVLNNRMQFNTGQLDQLRPFIKNISQMTNNRIDLGLEPSTVEYGWIRILEYQMLLGLISLDLTAAYQVYLKAVLPYEILYGTKHLVVILNEGYKKIYNYVWPNQNGDLNMKDRNKSFWKKDIGTIIDLQIPELKSEYSILTVALDTFYGPELKAMKIPRDMFVHYDDNPSELYDVLCSLDLEVITEKVIPFLDILKEMMAFTFRLQHRYAAYISATTEKMFSEHYQLLEDMKADKTGDSAALEIINKGQQNLVEMQRQYKAAAVY